MKRIITISCLGFLLSACMGTKNAINDDVVFQQSIPVCNNEKMCADMWQAAGDWVQLYSPQGIETYNDELIRSEERELGSEEMDITVKKIKLDEQQYQIVIDNSCNRSSGSCSRQRANMIAFNKKLTSFMPKAKQLIQKQAFDDELDVKQWFEQYEQAFSRFDAKPLATQMHFPVSFIEEETVIVVHSTEQLNDYLLSLKPTFKKLAAKYVKLQGIDVFARTGRNIYVNAEMQLYDIENTIVGGQQIAFHLVRVGDSWLLVSAAVHTQ